ncbi:hypothetical protein AAZX31_12G035000 [Glycine max]
MVWTNLSIIGVIEIIGECIHIRVCRTQGRRSNVQQRQPLRRAMCINHLYLPPLRRHNHFSASSNSPLAIRSQSLQQPSHQRFSPQRRQTLRTHPFFH